MENYFDNISLDLTTYVDRNLNSEDLEDDFFGRLRRLSEMVENNLVSVVKGPAGSGKSALVETFITALHRKESDFRFRIIDGISGRTKFINPNKSARQPSLNYKYHIANFVKDASQLNLFEENERVIIIIDNVMNVDSIKRYLVKSPWARYIVISRDYDSNEFPSFELPLSTPDIQYSLPSENRIAIGFEIDRNRIVLRRDLPDNLPTDEQAELYDSLRELTAELSGLCPQNSNRYGQQGKAVAAFLAALGDGYDSMRLSALWIAGQRMRRFERADDAKRKADDPEDDPMEPDQSALFAEVVTTYNVFSTGEPGLKAKDELGRDPATLSPDATEEARAVRGAVAEADALFDEEVPFLLDEVIEETADPSPGVAARGVVLTRETFENLLGSLARKAQSEPKPEPSDVAKGAKGEWGKMLVRGSVVAGTGTATAFIAVYETTLLAFAAKLPASAVWTAIIKAIAAGWAAVV